MLQRNALEKTKTLLTATILLAILFSLTSCKTTEYSKNSLTLEDLKDRIDKFKDHYVQETNNAAYIARTTLDSKRMNIKILQWQTKSIDAINTLSYGKDPMASLIDIWLLCVRQRNFFDNPSLRVKITDKKIIVYDKLIDDIKLIAKDFLSPELLASTEKSIEQEAAARPLNPGNLNLVMSLSAKKLKKDSPIAAALTLPLAPFEAMRGVDKGAMAMHNINLTARDLTDIIERLPTQIRWQLLLTFYELEDDDSIKELLANFEKLSNSSDKISNEIGLLPEKIGNETRLTISAADKMQPQLQRTLDKTTQATKQIDEALVHLDVAAKSTTELVRIFEPQETTNPEDAKTEEDSDEPSTIEQINNIIVESGKSAQNINQATVEIKSLLQQENLKAIDQLEKKFEQLTDHIFYRIAVLVGFIFILAVAYRAIFKRSK